MKHQQDYEKEARERPGDTEAYRENEEKMKNVTEEKKKEIAESLEQIFAEFSACRQSGAEPTSEAAQRIVVRLQNYITVTQYLCTKQILSFLGEVYVRDPRFLKSIDRHGEGTAAFASEAIKFYCRDLSENHS